jgi:hypothetical protein
MSNLLNLGLQHSFQKASYTSWKNLIIETERAIRLLDDKLKAPFRLIAANKLKQLHLSNNNNTLHKRQLHILKQINLKITEGNAMIAKADKSKTTVIIYTRDYIDQVHSFLTENKFQPIPTNPTAKV